MGTRCDKCDKVGHFAKVCRSGQGQLGGKEPTVKKELEPRQVSSTRAQAVEATWAYPEGNWACQVSAETDSTEFKSISPERNKYPEFYKDILLCKLPGKARQRSPLPRTNPYAMIGTVMAIMTGSVILSARPSGEASMVQSALTGPGQSPWL